MTADSTELPAPSGPKGPVDLALAAVQALRPKQWAKQVFVLAAIIFSRNYADPELWVQTAIAVGAFCLVSSSGYIINDIRDIDADRAHPKKSKRPMASGRLPIPLAMVEGLVVFALGVALAWSVSPGLVLVVMLYFCTTMSYSLYFKNVVILDIMFISAGFLWRAAGGAVAIDVNISPWLLLCTAFVSLFLGFNKRRGELMLMRDRSTVTRPILAEYSLPLVVEFQALTTSGTIISYALYTVLGSPTPWLLLTLPYVLYGVFRYMYLVTVRNEGGAPEETLYKDPPILVNGVLYGITVVVILVLVPTAA